MVGPIRWFRAFRFSRTLPAITLFTLTASAAIAQQPAATTDPKAAAPAEQPKASAKPDVAGAFNRPGDDPPFPK